MILPRLSKDLPGTAFRAAPIPPVPRAFSTTATQMKRAARTHNMDLKALKVNQERLMADMHHTANFGKGLRWGTRETETGMARLALTDTDKEARDWFVSTTQALGCTVTVDQMGNIFAVRAGRSPDLAPIFAGSHLDTQPAGGRYDGILGVTAGIEMLRVLQENQVETTHPVGVVNWTNEEGARFPVSMLSSGVWAGAIPVEQAHGLPEVGPRGAMLKSELERIGYLGPVPASHLSTPMAAHFELHIEQGPILEANKQKIGVVRGVQAYNWFTIEVQGKASHTGTTPYSARSDALLAASKMIVQSNIVSAKLGGLASTGILKLEPGSTNTIPDCVRFSLDVRAHSDDIVEAIGAQLREDFESISVGREVNGNLRPTTASLPVSTKWTTDSNSPATHFHSNCINAAQKSAQGILGDASLFREMTSGAGHDSVYASRRCPTSMIFVPSKNGISHHPEEWTSPEDCALGAEVLCHSVVRYDQFAS